MELKAVDGLKQPSWGGDKENRSKGWVGPAIGKARACPVVGRVGQGPAIGRARGCPVVVGLPEGKPHRMGDGLRVWETE